nr:uncharacterized protein LOC109152052 isoform X1 [Ipomoea trifida]GMD82531.1 Protein SODIUM POTASSIUM ROOT DEFECTIVE 1 like [Ipomoea batatas]
MEKTQKQALFNVANLKLPSFQVVVVNANLGCAHCRRRISQVVLNITGLREYTMDVLKRQVIVKGGIKNNFQNRNNTKLKDERCRVKFFARLFCF